MIAIESAEEASCTRSMTRRTLRIGGGSGFWGDSADGAAQLVRKGQIDVLILDYLSEITMSLLARARQKRADLGYASDFVSAVMEPLASEIAQRKIKVIANAGGVNPDGCRDALLAALSRLGVPLQVASVTGDDLTERVPHLAAQGLRDLDTGEPLPTRTASANAYFGAFPIARALEAGADVVITGRCADSALALGPLIASYGWRESDLDRLALGSLIGHVLECGAQATGGTLTDWELVADGWDDMGYPIAEYEGGDSFVVSKPAGTHGLVTPASVAEQISYEIHDPRRYVLPDVVCDFSTVQLEAVGPDRVRVRGARGLPPTPDYKASLTYADGFRCTATVMIVGRAAAARAERVGAAIVKRTRRLFAERGYADYRATSIEVLGAESMYGPHARARDSREVILKVAVAHAQREPLELFSREIAPAITSMAQGLSGFSGGRPAVQPVVRLASCYVPKAELAAHVECGSHVSEYVPPVLLGEGRDLPIRTEPPPISHEASAEPGPYVEVPLLRLAYGRSGDKGDTSNISVLARRPEFVPLLARTVSAERVRRHLAHLVHGEVERYDWPGLDGFNFVLRRALGGGGIASLRYDPQGKSYAQILLDMPVSVPAAWLERYGLAPGCPPPPLG